jgi:ABC-2 type transport system ATP-binding protein
MPDTAIKIEDLHVVRGGRPVLHGLNLQVAGGSVTGLLGPSGCGKSTLMRAIVGVQIVQAGQVSVLGEHAGSPTLRRRVGYLTQVPSVYADLSIAENLRYFAAILNVGEQRIGEVVQTVGLAGREQQVVASLSGGERSRVSLATALLGDPELLVLDEPTVGLDPVLRAELWGTFRELAQAGSTLLISSHVMDEAGKCDELLLMREGALATAMRAVRRPARDGRRALWALKRAAAHLRLRRAGAPPIPARSAAGSRSMSPAAGSRSMSP